MLDKTFLKKRYQSLNASLKKVRAHLKRPLTYTEKILFSHAAMLEKEPEKLVDIARGRDYVLFHPDRVAMQDATAQMALLQFMSADLDRTAVPTTVHCDHLIRAEHGAEKDLANAFTENQEVFDFLQSVSARYGIGFWKPGSGIIHQVLLENYASPGMMMIGTDSHTPNAGGLGMIAIGVGGADSVDVMAGLPWELKFPKVIGVHLKGSLDGWTSAKDVILEVAGQLTVKGGTGAIIEYFGSGASTLSCTGKATICNMGAEIGATTSLFPYDESMRQYLIATGREELLESIDPDLLQIDEQVLGNPAAYYDQLIEIDLSELSPRINGPYTPDLCRTVEQMKEVLKQEDIPKNISVALIGSCTNSSYEDLQRTCSIAMQAKKEGLRCKVPLTITPGSDLIYSHMQKEGMVELLESIGGTVLANACGPCIGQWKRHDVKDGEKNTIVTSFNRNFAGRNDANPATCAFVAGPEMVMAYALSGQLDFDPRRDMLQGKSGPFLLHPPEGKALPSRGFEIGKEVDSLKGLIALEPSRNQEVVIDPDSSRLQRLSPFAPPCEKEFSSMPLLLKAQGKCTTDHISPAGKWLRFRGHLDNISDNMFIGAMNAFEDLIGEGICELTGEKKTFSQMARALKKAGKPWVVVGADNYGEGSSREHAAMEPRHLGGKIVIVKSFARIHESNLKKQGIFPLTFKNSDDYDLIEQGDRFSFPEIQQWLRGESEDLPSEITAHVHGKKEKRITLLHTLNRAQQEWIRLGSALNALVASKKSC